MNAMSPDATLPPPRLLVVEDEPKTRESIAEGFRQEGWTVITASDGESALALFERESFDLLVIDWMLPKCDGLEVLRGVRRRGHPTMVLMLTARDAVDDRVRGLESGADDYLPKPFSFAELLARCRALLRRQSISASQVLQCGDLKLDTRAHTATRAGREIQLTQREADVLEYLLRRQGQTVTQEMLERDVWKQTHRFTSLDNVIHVQMMRLRRKVDDEAGAKLIHTVRGVGYRMGEDRP
jgi:DNA-binding response OmpR family regulator